MELNSCTGPSPGRRSGFLKTKDLQSAFEELQYQIKRNAEFPGNL
jgi:hypothetical protein